MTGQETLVLVVLHGGRHDECTFKVDPAIARSGYLVMPEVDRDSDPLALTYSKITYDWDGCAPREDGALHFHRH